MILILDSRVGFRAKDVVNRGQEVERSPAWLFLRNVFSESSCGEGSLTNGVLRFEVSTSFPQVQVLR